MTSTRLFLTAVAVTSLSLTACSFSMKAGTDANSANQANSNSNSSSGSTSSTDNSGSANKRIVVPNRMLNLGKLKRVGNASIWLNRRPGAGGTGSSSGSTSTDPEFVSANTVFGGPDGTENSFVGMIYFLDAGATALPTDLDTRPAKGVMFTNTFNVAANTTFAGFPGVEDRKENFAVRYEGDLAVSSEADYELRLVSDDGAKVYLNDTLVLDNDGVKSSATEAKATVRLSKATYSVRVDYFHTTGPVALQLLVKPQGLAEVPLTSKL